MIDFLSLIEFQFFRNALLAALLTSIMAGIAGTYIVSRKIVFISGGITHASFGGIGLAYFLGINPFIGATFFAVISGLGIEWISSKANVREDSAIAIWWSLGMAIGIIFIFLTPGYAPNLMSFLFGSILTVTTADLLTMGALNLVLISLIFLFFRPILYSSFDPEHARASGLPVTFLKYLMIVLISLTIVISIRIAGVILVLSLFTIPQATANIYSKNFKDIIWLSIGFSILGSFSGIILSYHFDIPSGAAIIFSLTSIWGINKAVHPLIRKAGGF